jgi:hypothetical protein
MSSTGHLGSRGGAFPQPLWCRVLMPTSPEQLIISPCQWLPPAAPPWPHACNHSSCMWLPNARRTNPALPCLPQSRATKSRPTKQVHQSFFLTGVKFARESERAVDRQASADLAAAAAAAALPCCIHALCTRPSASLFSRPFGSMCPPASFHGALCCLVSRLRCSMKIPNH